jgi:hypothetical protein
LHFGLSFMHWLPRPLGRLIAPISPFGLFAKARPRDYFDETRLLSRSELARLCPRADMVKERFLGIPKSYLAIGRN